jgi:hypothetical protein
MGQPLLPCDICPERATVVYLIGVPGLEGIPVMDQRMWSARCAAHPSRAMLSDDTLAVGITSVVASV